MSELRVPTLEVPAEVACADGRTLAGSVFLPTGSRHVGPMRADEWLNEPVHFFPFRPNGGGESILLNKDQVLAVTVPDSNPPSGDEPGLSRRVEVQFATHSFKGQLRIDMPAEHSRVQDYLNRGDRFLALHDGDRLHLLHKEHIVEVLEIPEL